MPASVLILDDDGTPEAMRDRKGNMRPIKVDVAPAAVTVNVSTHEPVKSPDIMDFYSADKLGFRPEPGSIFHAEYLIKGVLYRNTDAQLVGESGSFKSFVAIDLGLHVAEGRDWGGKRVKQANVVYVAAEGRTGVNQRLAAWSAEHGRDRAPNMKVYPQTVLAADPEGWTAWVERIRAFKPGLVILDTQARIASGIDENSNTAMVRVLEAAEEIRNVTGACVLLVHHAVRSDPRNPDAKPRSRGASVLDGAMDTRLIMVRKNKEFHGKLMIDKQKDGEEGSFIIKVRKHTVWTDEDGDEVTSLGARASTEEEKALEPRELTKQQQDLLRLIGQGITRQSELAKHIGKDGAAVKASLTPLAKATSSGQIALVACSRPTAGSVTWTLLDD